MLKWCAVTTVTDWGMDGFSLRCCYWSFWSCVCVRASLIFSDSSTNLYLVAVIGVPVVVLTCHSTTETQKTHKTTEISSRMFVPFLLVLVWCVRIDCFYFARFFLTYQNIKYAMIRLRRISLLIFYSFDFIHSFSSSRLVLPTITKIES